METSTRKPKISDSTSEGIDRISSLPDEVLHNILSNLVIFDDIVQLSVLSKRWKYIWTTMPYLHFDIRKFCREKGVFYVTNKEKFRDFINWVLISQRETKLVSFLLCVNPRDTFDNSRYIFDNSRYIFDNPRDIFDYPHDIFGNPRDIFDNPRDIFDKMDILRWIHAATRRNVQEVVLEYDLSEPFELPFCLAACESLQVLKLNLPGDILKLPNHFGFRRLEMLHLEDVALSDEHFSSCFFSKCHLLKSLILHECSLEAMTLLSIASTSLISLTILADYHHADDYAKCELRISCPNLKYLNYQAPMPKDIIIENRFSIEDVSIFFINILADTGIFVHKMFKDVSSTSALTLCNASNLGMYEAISKQRLSSISFYKLKTLKLYLRIDKDSMQAMILLLKYSPNLEVLQLCPNENGCWLKNWQMHDLDESIVSLESHLKSIHLTGFRGTEYEIKLLKFFLKNARVLEKLIIFWEENPDKSEEALEEVLKFPRTSSQVVLTFLDAKPQPRPSHKWYDRYSK